MNEVGYIEGTLPNSPPENLRIVAIGASAGGLEPFEKFFGSTKDHLGVAYVIIQHLSPNFHSMMDELLSRHSSMNIERVIHGMRIEPDTIYLNPPRTEMIVKNGKFELTEYSEQQQLNLPIDRFFESLAKEAGSDAIAIVLSGTGSDGTKGAQAVKAMGGTVLAQDLSSAKFDGMPGSIINLGYADAVGYPEMLAENVSRLVRGKPLTALMDDDKDLTTSDRILRRLRERFGTEFGYYKSATINRRLERRANLRNMSMSDYADILAEDPDESAALYADLLIEVTAFFRDGEAFDELREKVVPELAAKMSIKTPVRIWVPGCASGEEAYSMAIMFADYARENGLDLNLKILATDIHHRSLDAASAGMYPKTSLEGLTAEQIERYFDEDGDYCQVKQSLRRIVVFSPHNILKDPPFTRMHLISCRNVLIYFKEVAQQKSVALFHFALRKDGFLFLGPSETTGNLEHEFTVTSPRWRIFRKKRDVRLLESTSLLPAKGQHDLEPGRDNDRMAPKFSELPTGLAIHKQAHNDTLKEMLRLYAPPGFLLNRDGEILHVFGDSGQVLNINSGRFSNKIVDLIGDDDLRLIITTGIERVKATGKLPFERRIDMKTPELGAHSVVISLRTISQYDATNPYLLLTIERVKTDEEETPPINVLPLEATEATQIMQKRIVDLETDLKATEESLQTTIEELETSNEELQATNEELMASNEELQSTNEELHSVNEELYTVSAEHQRKIGELVESTDDMEHLLKATNIGIVFLDDLLHVRRYTPAATDTFNLIKEDIGRPFDHITYRFESFDMGKEIGEVRKTGQVFEREVSVGEKAFMLRILPYRASLQEIVGAVITTVDVSDLKSAERAREEATANYARIVRDITSLLVRWDADTGAITFCTPTFSIPLGQNPENLIGTNIAAIGKGGERQRLFANLSDLKDDLEFENEILSYDSSGNPVFISGTIHVIRNEAGQIQSYQAMARDVTPQFRYRRALEALLKVQDNLDKDDESALFENILSIGRDYLDMSDAVLTDSDKTTMSAKQAQGGAKQMFQLVGSRRLEGTLSGYFSDTHGIFSCPDISNSPIAKIKQAKEIGMQSLIGANFNAPNGNVITLMFADYLARAEGFTVEEEMFTRLLAQTLEHLFERRNALANLEKSRVHFETVYAQSPIMKCTVDKTGQILQTNSAFLKTFKYAEKSILGKDLRDLLEDHNALEPWDKFLKASFKKEKKPRAIAILSKDKKKVRTELAATPILSPDTGEQLYLITILDVTDRNAAFDKIEKQKNELERANEGLSTFAYVASHDLQEPLRKIQQYVELLERDFAEKVDKDGKFYLDVITGSASRISYLVRDILSYTTASNTKVDIVDVDLSKVIAATKRDLDEDIVESGATLKIGKLPTVKGDESAAKLIFQNLLSNGLKYHEKDTKPVLTVKSKRQKNGPVIEFTDNGIGIQNAGHNNIYDPFVRLHSKSEFSGSGIGLAICKTLCDRMGWTISHRPNPNGGTVFSVKCGFEL